MIFKKGILEKDKNYIISLIKILLIKKILKKLILWCFS